MNCLRLVHFKCTLDLSIGNHSSKVYVGVVGVAGSNPVAPTIFSRYTKYLRRFKLFKPIAIKSNIRTYYCLLVPVRCANAHYDSSFDSQSVDCKGIADNEGNNSIIPLKFNVSNTDLRRAPLVVPSILQGLEKDSAKSCFGMGSHGRRNSNLVKFKSSRERGNEEWPG